MWHEVGDKMVPLTSVCERVCDGTVGPACLAVVRDSFVLPSSLQHRGKPRNNTVCVTTAVYHNTMIDRSGPGPAEGIAKSEGDELLRQRIEELEM